jgi:phosphoribosylformimino-5-aminoimidazole carboxamide ribotide isomerase
MVDATVYSGDPAAQARTWQDAGFRWLHVVDLDGAFAGRSLNAAAVASILASVTVPVQLGGGIRDRAAIEHWLAAGFARVILGSAAARDPALVRAACRDHPGRIAIGIDARGGRVAVQGWAESAELGALELALRFEDAGAAAIIYTDISRDGMLSGPDIAGIAELAARISTPLIASGGVASLADLAALRETAAGRIEGVIIGRALYDGRIVPAEALAP